MVWPPLGGAVPQLGQGERPAGFTLGATPASFDCLKNHQPNPSVDESVNNARDQSIAMSYIRSHEADLPRVTLARIGRGLGLYQPMEQVRFDSVIETRPYHWWLTGLYVYYALLVLSVGGSFILRRRRSPSSPCGRLPWMSCSCS